MSPLFALEIVDEALKPHGKESLNKSVRLPHDYRARLAAALRTSASTAVEQCLAEVKALLEGGPIGTDREALEMAERQIRENVR